MNKDYHNTHTISDSDDSISVIGDHQANYASSPEPEFFYQVIQCVCDLYNLVT